MTELSLRTPAHLVGPRARWYWTVRALSGWLAVLAIEVLIWVADGDHDAVHLVVLIATLTVGAVHVAVMPQWRYRVHRWEVTGTAVYTQTGWLTQERRIAPVARIQTVDTQRGPFEQLFGLANITVTTASAAGPLKIHGLARGVADSLVGELTVRTQRSAGDGT